jgi:hypothetical protein
MHKYIYIPYEEERYITLTQIVSKKREIDKMIDYIFYLFFSPFNLN